MTSAADAPATVRQDGEPSESGWDAADTVTSFPEPEALPEPIRKPLPGRAGDAPPPSVTKPYVAPPPLTAPSPMSVTATAQHPSPRPAAGAPATGLGAPMREEVWTIVRAAVDEAVRPLLARQRDLEERLERAEVNRSNVATEPLQKPVPQAQRAAPVVTAAIAVVAPPVVHASSATAKLASIPVALGSIAPAVSASAVPAPQTQAPRTDPMASSGGHTIPDIRLSLPPSGVRGSLPPQGYGVVVMTSTRPTLDLDAVGHVDIDGFDGGRRKRLVGRIVVVVLLLVIGAAITMTLISRS